MKFGKRRWEPRLDTTSASASATPSSEHRPQSWSAGGHAPPVGATPAAEADDDAETVVEGEAVELPAQAPAAEAQRDYPQSPAPMPFPVAGEPVAVVTAGPETGGVAPLAEAAPLYASGHAHGTAPSWPEPVMELAAERPEIVVGAAFVGGLLVAAILRRLGN